MVKMQTVFQLTKLRNVPKSYLECSVCGLWKPFKSFTGDGKNRTRTNCVQCYHLSSKDMEELSTKTLNYKKSSEYVDLKENFNFLLELEEYSMPVKDLVEQLLKLPKGSRVCVTQDGYYADGKFGAVGLDLASKYTTSDGHQVFSVGHSSQNC